MLFQHDNVAKAKEAILEDGNESGGAWEVPARTKGVTTAVMAAVKLKRLANKKQPTPKNAEAENLPGQVQSTGSARLRSW